MMRGLVVVGALPVLTLIGVYAGRTKRRQTIERIGHEGRTKLRAAIVRSVTSLLSAHRDHNVRWVRARCTELENSLSEWWKIAVVPALGKVEEEVNAQAHSAKIDQRRLSDEHSKLKRTRDDVAGKLLFDLKRHHRELSEQSSGD